MTNPLPTHVYLLSVIGHDFQTVLGVCDSLEAADHLTQQHCSAMTLQRTDDQIARLLPMAPWKPIQPGMLEEQLLLIYRENPESVNNEYLHLIHVRVNEYAGRFGQGQHR